MARIVCWCLWCGVVREDGRHGRSRGRVVFWLVLHFNQAKDLFESKNDFLCGHSCHGPGPNCTRDRLMIKFSGPLCVKIDMRFAGSAVIAILEDGVLHTFDQRAVCNFAKISDRLIKSEIGCEKALFLASRKRGFLPFGKFHSFGILFDVEVLQIQVWLSRAQIQW